MWQGGFCRSSRVAFLGDSDEQKGAPIVLVTSPRVAAAVSAFTASPPDEASISQAVQELAAILTSQDQREHAHEALAFLCTVLSDPSPFAYKAAQALYDRLVSAQISVFEFTKMHGARLSGADLKGFPLRKAFLPGADLVGARLVECHLCEAQLSGANLTNVITGPNTSFSGVTALGARFTNASLRETNFDESDLRGADFTAADLWKATMANTTARGANFTDAELEKALLYCGDWRGANFAGAMLDGATLRGKDESMVDLRGSNLTGAFLGGATLEWVDLRGANLTSTVFNGAELMHVNLDGAITEDMRMIGTQVYSVHGLPEQVRL